MANAIQICRICMSNNIKMFTLKNTNMENLYHLLTQVYVDTEDQKPTTVCYLCYARLQQCERLQQQAIKSNEVLEKLLKGGFMEATANAILNNQYTSQDLQISSINYLNLEPANCQVVNNDVNDLISVKEEEESIDEGCNVTGFPEDSNYCIDFDYEVIKSDPERDQPSIGIVSNKSDGSKNIAHGKEGAKRQEIENVCIIHQEKRVRNNPCPSNSNRILKTSYNNKEAQELNMTSARNVKKMKNTNKQYFQKPLNNNEDAGVDKKSEKIWEESKINTKKVQKSIHDKDTQEEKINTPQTSVINTIICEFQCNECGKQFSTKDSLTNHIFKCMKTIKTSLRDNQLTKADMVKSLLSEMYSCDICTFKTKRKLSIVTHLKMHNVTKVLSCNICEYKCSHKGKFKDHMRIHTGEKPFSCDICDYKCSHKRNLIDHIRIHTGVKPFSCNICSFKTYNKRSIQTHLKMHNVTKFFFCSICEYRCAKKNTLKRHMKTHTGEKPFSCNICEYRCAQKVRLKTHMRTHTGEKPFSCYICNYKCSQKCNLKLHMRIHTGEKPFSCNICEYRCSLKSNLKYHMRLHTGEKPFSCNICQYRCAIKVYLKTHMRIHTGEKPFSCNICKYKSSLKYKLKDHMRIHTGEKPFSCNICEYRCSRKSSLNGHMRIHTGEKPFSCNICEYRCIQKSSLKRHLRTHN